MVAFKAFENRPIFNLIIIISDCNLQIFKLFFVSMIMYWYFCLPNNQPEFKNFPKKTTQMFRKKKKEFSQINRIANALNRENIELFRWNMFSKHKFTIKEIKIKIEYFYQVKTFNLRSVSMSQSPIRRRTRFSFSTTKITTVLV